MRSVFSALVLCLLTGCAEPKRDHTGKANSGNADALFQQLAEDYLSGYLAWRPQTGTALGLHQYDGKVTDYSKTSLATELKRLKSFEARLTALDPQPLSASSAYDYRILSNAVRREIFGFEQMQLYTRNPMTYAGA